MSPCPCPCAPLLFQKHGQRRDHCRAGRIGDRVEYKEELAYQDFAPYAYLDGFHSDDSTRGTNNERAFAVQEGTSRVLEVVLPEGCVTSACAMQSKSVMMMPVEEATLKFRLVPVLYHVLQSNTPRFVVSAVSHQGYRLPPVIVQGRLWGVQNEVWPGL